MGGLGTGGLVGQIVGTLMITVGTLTANPALTVWGVGLMTASSIAVALDPMQADDPDDPKFKNWPGFQPPRNAIGPDSVIPVVYGKAKVYPVITQAFITPLDKQLESLTEEGGLQAHKTNSVSMQCQVSEGPIESIESIQINDQELWEDVTGDAVDTGAGSVKTFRLPRKWLDRSSIVIYVAGTQKTKATTTNVDHYIGVGNGTRKNFKYVADDPTSTIDMDSINVYYNHDDVPATQSYSIKGLSAYKFEVKFDKKVPDKQEIRVTFTYHSSDGDAYLVHKKGWTDVKFRTAPTGAITYDAKVQNFPDVTIETYLGAVNQAPIEGADQVRNAYTVGEELLEAQPVTYTTAVPVDDVSVSIAALQGMILHNSGADSGKTTPRQADVTVDYRITGAATWTALKNPEGGVEFVLKGETPTTKRWEISILETLKRGLESGVTEKDQLEEFVRGTYDVRLVRINKVKAEFESGRQKDRVWFTHATEVQVEKLSYPGTAGFWLHAVASSRLQGSLPTISAVVKGRKVKNLDAGTTAWSRNPAWCVADMLTSTRYGAGIAEADLITADWTALATWADASVTLEDETTETRCQLDAVLNVQRPPVAWARDLLVGAFAVPVLHGKKWGVFVDKARDVDKTYAYEGSSANVELASLSKATESRAKTPTELELTYLDVDEDYDRETVLIVPTTRNDYRVKSKFMLPGVVRRTQAIRVGNHMLRSTANQATLCEFIALPDGALTEAGDVVLVKSEVGGWTSGKKFRVLRVGFDAKLRVHLLCREYDANLYAASSSELPSASSPTTKVVNSTPSGPTSTSPNPATETSPVKKDGILFKTVSLVLSEITEGIV